MQGRQSGIEFVNAPILRLLNVARHVVPTALRPRLRRLLLPLSPLNFSRPSGVQLRIANDTDWAVYTEVFRKAEYDSAIDRAVALPDAEHLCIVDLGANVGFFTLRVIDRLGILETRSRDVRIIAVEASPRRVADFRSRVVDTNGLGEHVRVFGGLVGDRLGSAPLFEGPSHGDSSLFSRRESPTAGEVLAFVDLSALLASEPAIHLLKCDIEGAELQFLRTYGDLLMKTRVAVFEFHDELCDTAACRRLLRDYGFGHETVVRRTGPYEIYCVWR